jgi:hypothetical protein
VNLFVLNMPRLSVDIDLNYVGALNREKMLSDRPRIEQAAHAVFSREGFIVNRSPSSLAGSSPKEIRGLRLQCKGILYHINVHRTPTGGLGLGIKNP